MDNQIIPSDSVKAVVPTWKTNLIDLAIKTVKTWASEGRDITSLDLKNELRSVVGLDTSVLQVDVSRFLQHAMKRQNAEFFGTSGYASRQMTCGVAKYLLYYQVVKTQAKLPSDTAPHVEAASAVEPKPEPKKATLIQRIIAVFKP
jgi:hypothetical protein